MGMLSSFQFVGIFLGGTLAGLIRTYFIHGYGFLACLAVCVMWFFFMVFMKKSLALKTKVIPVDAEHMSKQKAQQLAKQLLKLPGVIDAEVCIEDGIAYLKVDNKMFDQARLEEATLACS